MKVNIIMYNVNQGPPGGVSVGELAPTRFPEIFLFLFFLFRCIGVCASFVHLFATFSWKSVM